MTDASCRNRAGRERQGVAIAVVLYFLVVCSLTIAAVLFAHRSATGSAHAAAVGAHLLTRAEAVVYDAVAHWDAVARERQPVGTTVSTSWADGGVEIALFLTRLDVKTFSIIADASSSQNVGRRSELLVRLPVLEPRVRAALVSAVGVTLGPGVRFAVDSGACGDSTASIALAPGVTATIDPSIPADGRPVVRVASIAADSATYLRLAEAWWSEMTSAADITLARDATVAPWPVVVGGSCVHTTSNWGDPAADVATSACTNRTPVVYAPGDLTISGGVGQGVLLVDGHLVITGPFRFSGQIVARHGIETRADNIAISGVVSAWRASADSSASHVDANEITLTHTTTVRYSGCDARHGIASSFQPRRVRERASMELF